MKQLLFLCICFCGTIISAQQEFHVFPINDVRTPGSNAGDGSITNPWDLQTALSQKPEMVTSGDTIWLHEGIYNGRYVSTLKSLDQNKYITVAAFKDDKVVLNGNVPGKQTSVLQVRSTQVIYKNFEVTWLGDYSRDQKDDDFEFCIGIEHLNGENCRFYNIIIHDNPGLGFGSWKRTAGTIIENCIIYNNGFIAKTGKGAGEGIYVQNQSDEIRLLKNNIIFNNYYKGIEVWSAGNQADFEFVKNITLNGNIVFNSGTPSGVHRDNVIVASNDRNGINIAHDIFLQNNVLYHNTHKSNGKRLGDAPSLTLGFNVKAPVEDIYVNDNVIFGGNNAIRFSIARSLNFSNNQIYGGALIGPNTSGFLQDWNFKSNTYYTQGNVLYRVSKGQKYSLDSWQRTFGLELGSVSKNHENVDLKNGLHLSEHSQIKGKYNVALYSAQGQDVTVDFSDEALLVGQTYRIYDVENRKEVLRTGTVTDDLKITFPMENNAFRRPRHNSKAKKTLSNFGVFIIEFETPIHQDIVIEEKESALKRFFKWLGF